MSDLDAEVSYHKFHPQSNRFHPLHFFSDPGSGALENFSCSSYGINTIGITRAPLGDGKEAIILATPYNSSKSDLGNSLSMGIAFLLFSLLSQVTWLAKDIIWIVADSRYGEYAPVAAWLKDYHVPKFSSLSSPNVEMCRDIKNLYESNGKSITGDFRCAGTMAVALVLKVSDRTKELEDTVSIYAEASNGQMPNLDLTNIVSYLSAHYRQGFCVKVERLWSLLDCSLLKILGTIIESVGEVARSLNPEWKFGIPATDYIEGNTTLASSLYSQIYAESSKGQMPNLDLINILYYLAAHYRQGFHVKVERLWSLLDCSLLKVLGTIIEYVGEVARSVNPEWKFGVPTTDCIEGTATLASSLYSQALGVPTVTHGAFRDYQVDAITLEFSPKFTSEHNDFSLRAGQFIGVIRSVNNLLEKFHQLFFLYLLTSLNKFVSVGAYMIPFALLIAPLPMVAASIYINANNSNSTLKQNKSILSPFPAADEHSITVRS